MNKFEELIKAPEFIEFCNTIDFIAYVVTILDKEYYLIMN